MEAPDQLGDEPSDRLCPACSQVDIFPLFTGPRYFSGAGYDNIVSISLGTLVEINANIRCPFCRLLHHELYETRHLETFWLQQGCRIDLSKVKVKVYPIRVDYGGEEMIYTNGQTRDMVATMLQLHLYPLEGLTKREENLVRASGAGCGIQLLSPDFVDPARPLLNGYQVSTATKSLELLRQWMRTCVVSHTLKSKKGTCRRPNLQDSGPKLGIRVIDVEQRIIVECDPEELDYAALSYVWGKDPSESVGLETDAAKGSFSTLPLKPLKVVEDAIFVCKNLGIPYLWVDRYCIDQSDLVRKNSEIKRMGYRYLFAKITLIAGMEPEAGLLPVSESDQMSGLQRVETVQGRKYITALPGVGDQIQGSQWARRGWTMQEGQLANRCAFFGKHGISFVCGSGQWREPLHSGPYGHDAEMKDIETQCTGHYLLSGLNWLNGNSWEFSDYHSLLNSYRHRELSFESDKLNAITGCLNLLTEKKGLPFFYGLPATDFHYALLWEGEYDRPRDGFPSFSWAGWHTQNQTHLVYPLESGTCSLKEDRRGSLQTMDPVYRDIELQGLLISGGLENPHHANKCTQTFAKITSPMYTANNLLTISSEFAHFFLDILSCSTEQRKEATLSQPFEIPHGFDSTIIPGNGISWDFTSEYWTPFERLCLRDGHGNTYLYPYPRWYDHWPPFLLQLPLSLRGETLTWLLKEGIELVMILELKLLEGDESLKPFHLVLCLGLDRREDIAKRCGMFCMSKEIWDKACPKMGTVILG